MSAPEIFDRRRRRLRRDRAQPRFADHAFLLDQIIESLLHRLAVKTVVSETYFFRHPEHFDLLVERLVPALLQEGRTTLRAWSAGCATGEEAYSLAAALMAAAPRAEIAQVVACGGQAGWANELT